MPSEYFGLSIAANTGDAKLSTVDDTNGNRVGGAQHEEDAAVWVCIRHGRRLYNWCHLIVSGATLAIYGVTSVISAIFVDAAGKFESVEGCC